MLPLEPTPAIPIDHENNCDSGGKDAEAPQQLNLSVAPGNFISYELYSSCTYTTHSVQVTQSLVKEHQSNRSPLKRKYEDITKCTALRVLYVDLGLQVNTYPEPENAHVMQVAHYLMVFSIGENPFITEVW